MKRRKLPVVQVRPCAGCSACCTVLGVRELEKAPWMTCKHVVPKGCGIYETRPPICGKFYCLWQSGVGEDRDRPDHLGVVFAPTDGPTEFTHEVEVQAYEVVADAFNRPRVVEIAKRFLAKGRLVVGHTFGGGSFRFLGPPEKVRLAKQWVEENRDKPLR
jgi:hypothetical protein